jgi:hypothetical protein
MWLTSFEGIFGCQISYILYQILLFFQIFQNCLQVEEDDIVLDTFEDKDPFDTSAYEDIAGVLEEELGFESLAKRDPKDDLVVDDGAGGDVFGVVSASDPVVESGWAAFKEEKPARPPPPKPKPEPPRRPPQVYINPSSRPNTPSVVVKAPSTESIKSWNCAVAENLIRKSEIEALEAEVLAEEEFDPFDTTKFEEPNEEKEENTGAEAADPFDTSEVPDFEKEERLKRQAAEEAEEESRKRAEIDLLTDGDDFGAELGELTIVPDKGPEPDPFDTGFAAKVLPNKGDPFDTSFVTGCPGKAEIHALEEEFIDKEEFDPRTAEGSSIPTKAVAPGAAGRARPKKGLATDLKVKVPIPVAAEVVETKPAEEEAAEEEEEDDPFDTSIVNKVIPVRKAKQRSDLSVEDEDFDPTHTFQQIEKDDFDPFDTTIADSVIPESAEKQVEPEPEEVIQEVPAPVEEPVVIIPEPTNPEPLSLEIDGKPFKILPPAPPRKVRRTVTADDDFDPRA